MHGYKNIILIFKRHHTEYDTDNKCSSFNCIPIII